MSSNGSLLPAARSAPAIRSLFRRACSRPERAFLSIQSSITLFGKSHFPVILVAGIFFVLINA